MEGLVCRCFVVGGGVSFFDSDFGGGEGCAETEEGTCVESTGGGRRHGGHGGRGGRDSYGGGRRDGRGGWGMRCSNRLYSSRGRGWDIGSRVRCINIEILDTISQLS